MLADPREPLLPPSSRLPQLERGRGFPSPAVVGLGTGRSDFLFEEASAWPACLTSAVAGRCTSWDGWGAENIIVSMAYMQACTFVVLGLRLITSRSASLYTPQLRAKRYRLVAVQGSKRGVAWARETGDRARGNLEAREGGDSLWRFTKGQPRTRRGRSLSWGRAAAAWEAPCGAGSISG
jgi:hypothetical protein